MTALVVTSDGEIPFTRPQSGVTPTADEHLATKAYVDAGGGGGVSDHGDLTGLADDDHTQYSRADGTRAFTGAVEGVDPTAVQHLVTVNWFSLQLDSYNTSLLGTVLPGLYQPLDATLTALAGLTTAADQLIYATGTNAFAMSGLSTAARTVLDDATVADMVNTLGGASSTGTGGLVRANGPTITLTNCTGLPHAGLVNVSGDALLGNAAGGGAVSEITLDGSMAFDAGKLTVATDGIDTVHVLDGAITEAKIGGDQVSNTKLANMANGTIKGRSTAGTGDPEDLTAAQVRALLYAPYTLFSEAGDPIRTIASASASEANLFSTTIASNTIGTGNRLRITIGFDVLNNSGGTINGTPRVKLGSTTLWGDAGGVATSANRRACYMQCELAGRGATNKQFVSGLIALGTADIGSVAGNGNFPGQGPPNPFTGTAAEDSTTSLTLAVSWQWASAATNHDVRVYAVLVEVIPAGPP